MPDAEWESCGEAGYGAFGGGGGYGFKGRHRKGGGKHGAPSVRIGDGQNKGKREAESPRGSKPSGGSSRSSTPNYKPNGWAPRLGPSANRRAGDRGGGGGLAGPKSPPVDE